MTMISYGRSLINGLPLCFILFTCVASAQSITATRIATTLSLDAQDLPVTITHVYELGRVQAMYSSNGPYTEPASGSLGKLESIVIFGTSVSLGAVDNETTPGTGRTALVSFTSTREGDGTITAKIEAVTN